MTQQQNAPQHAAGHDDHGGPVTLVKGLRRLLLAIVVIATFITMSAALGITDVWVGYLFALYWAGLQRNDFKKLRDSFVGAAFGLTAAYLVFAMPVQYGKVASVLCMLGVIFMVFSQMMRWFAMFVNMSTMLFMLVATIPSIQVVERYPLLLVALAEGALYFVLVIWVARQVTRRFAGGPALTSPHH